jgi:hypothetical protein
MHRAWCQEPVGEDIEASTGLGASLLALISPPSACQTLRPLSAGACAQHTGLGIVNPGNILSDHFQRLEAHKLRCELETLQ